MLSRIFDSYILQVLLKQRVESLQIVGDPFASLKAHIFPFTGFIGTGMHNSEYHHIVMLTIKRG